jgi:hypothetical protein
MKIKYQEKIFFNLLFLIQTKNRPLISTLNIFFNYFFKCIARKTKVSLFIIKEGYYNPLFFFVRV